MNVSHYRNWRPTPLIQFSLLLMAVLAVILLIYPESWPWILAVFVADHLLLTFAGLWPRCAWTGSNWTRLPPAAAKRGAIAITIDDGPDPNVTPAVLDILDRYGAKATFFCIAAKAQQYPELCRDIVDRGHCIENHSLHHRYHLPFLLLGGWFNELNAAQKCLTDITGRRPRFFRPPVGLRNPLLDPVLARLELQLVSWTRRGFDTVDKNPERVLAKLLDGLKAGDILLLHDGNAARSESGKAVIVDVLPALLEKLAAAGLHSITLDEAAEASRSRH